jgi:hypothetical protein
MHGCLSQICQCEGEDQCVVDTDFGYAWIDIIDNGVGTQITNWENGSDDGWFHVDLPFDFNWFGYPLAKLTPFQSKKEKCGRLPLFVLQFQWKMNEFFGRAGPSNAASRLVFVDAMRRCISLGKMGKNDVELSLPLA